MNPRRPPDLLAAARRVLKIEAEGLRRAQASLGKDFLEALRILQAGRGRVIVIGVGKSGLVGRKIAATLTSTGTSAVFMHPADALHGDLGMLTADDVVLALSFSGESEELRRLLPYVRERRVPVVAMTGRRQSRLAKASDCVLHVPVIQEACPYNITPTASTTAMLALGDALAMALMQAKGFNKKDFARLHPAGSLGRRLHLRAQDIMHTGDDNPVVLLSVPLRDALLIMTKTRRGAASVIDQKGKLAGYLTDGDLRRHMDHGKPLSLKMPVAKIMTKNPFCAAPLTTVEELLNIFKNRSFDTIPVVNENGEPVGIVDERDLL